VTQANKYRERAAGLVLSKATKQRFCQMAVLIEVTYCHPDFPEDDTSTDAAVYNVIHEKLRRDHIVQMDMYFNDLFKVGGLLNKFLACVYRTHASPQVYIRRSLCLYNLKNVAKYQPIFDMEGVPNVVDRVLNRVALIHEYVHDCCKHFHTSRYTVSSSGQKIKEDPRKGIPRW
jgi:hypothetical protein